MSTDASPEERKIHEEAVALCNQIQEQTDQILRGAASQASNSEVVVIAFAMFACSTAHQAAAIALVNARCLHPATDYDAALDMAVELIGTSYERHFSHAMQRRGAVQAQGRVH